MAFDAQALTQVRYEIPCPGVARIVLARPERKNAQGVVMTYEIDAALAEACRDPEVRVIILAGDGDHFCAGHDLSGTERSMPDEGESRGLWNHFDGPGWEGFYAREHELYLDITERWRNAPKPTIAQVQGAVVSGGCMLVWACDLVIASEDARFRDNTPDMAMPGAEFFAHPWELGVRKAKEWLFTSDWLTAVEAERFGMVNRVVPNAELASATLQLAEKIAEKDGFTLKLLKESINAAQDAMGRRQAMSVSFALHQIGHLQNLLVRGFPIDTSKLAPSVRGKLDEMKVAGTGFGNLSKVETPAT